MTLFASKKSGLLSQTMLRHRLPNLCDSLASSADYLHSFEERYKQSGCDYMPKEIAIVEDEAK